MTVETNILCHHQHSIVTMFVSIHFPWDALVVTKQLNVTYGPSISMTPHNGDLRWTSASLPISIKMIWKGVAARGRSRHAARKQAGQARLQVNESKDTRELLSTHSIFEPRSHLSLAFHSSRVDDCLGIDVDRASILAAC